MLRESPEIHSSFAAHLRGALGNNYRWLGFDPLDKGASSEDDHETILRRNLVRQFDDAIHKTMFVRESVRLLTGCACWETRTATPRPSTPCTHG